MHKKNEPVKEQVKTRRHSLVTPRGSPELIIWTRSCIF